MATEASMWEGEQKTKAQKHCQKPGKTLSIHPPFKKPTTRRMRETRQEKWVPTRLRQVFAVGSTPWLTPRPSAERDQLPVATSCALLAASSPAAQTFPTPKGARAQSRGCRQAVMHAESTRTAGGGRQVENTRLHERRQQPAANEFQQQISHGTVFLYKTDTCRKQKRAETTLPWDALRLVFQQKTDKVENR